MNNEKSEISIYLHCNAKGRIYSSSPNLLEFTDVPARWPKGIDHNVMWKYKIIDEFRAEFG